MNMKVVLATRVAVDPVLTALKSTPGVEVLHCKDHGEVPAALRGAEVLVMSDPKGAEGAPIAAALRDPACTIKWIHMTTAGADGLLLHGVPSGVLVSNQGGAVAPTVAESAMAMILTMTRRIPEIIARSSRKAWIKEFEPPLMALEGR